MTALLNDKVAVVTGGSRGIGEEIAKSYAEQGAAVVIVGRNQERCEEVAHHIESANGKALPVVADLAKMDQIKVVFQKVRDEFGRLDILVNNAGVNQTRRAIEVTEEEWDQILDINLKSLFFCSQEAAKIMISQKSGKMINIASVGASRAYRNIAPYSISKAGVVHLTRLLSNEWARYNILVNGIAPGLISTDINKDDLADPDKRDRMLKMIPLRKLGTPKDIANMAVYLASDLSNYITGQIHFVDGGKTVE